MYTIYLQVNFKTPVTLHHLNPLAGEAQAHPKKKT